MKNAASLLQTATHAQLDERAVLGCLMQAGETERSAFLAAIRLDAFTDDLTLVAIKAIRDLHEGDRPIDAVEVTKVVSKGSFDSGLASTLSECAEAVPSAAGFTTYLQAVLEACRRRRLAIAADMLASAVQDKGDDLTTALSAIDAARHQTTSSAGEDSKTVTHALLDDIQARHALNGRLTGTSYGIDAIDRITDGIQPGEYVVIGARPSIGKTAIAVTLMHNMAVALSVPCSFITLETKPVGIHRRLLANVSGVPLGVIRSGQVGEVYRTLTVAASRIAKAPIRYHYGLGTMDGQDAANVIRQDARLHGTKVVFIDYLQHLRVDAGAEKRTYGIAANSAEIKRACDETGVAVIALAQLNREAEDDARLPKISEIAECSHIERDADTIMLLHRKRDESVGDAVIVISKARDGECGAVAMHYHGPTVRFTERSRLESVR